MLKNVEGVKHKRHGDKWRQLGTLKGTNKLKLDVSFTRKITGPTKIQMIKAILTVELLFPLELELAEGFKLSRYIGRKSRFRRCEIKILLILGTSNSIISFT